MQTGSMHVYQEQILYTYKHPVGIRNSRANHENVGLFLFVCIDTRMRLIHRYYSCILACKNAVLISFQMSITHITIRHTHTSHPYSPCPLFLAQLARISTLAAPKLLVTHKSERRMTRALPLCYRPHFEHIYRRFVPGTS